MRVGFSVVAGAVASVLMCFGFFVAHMEMVYGPTTLAGALDSDHEVFLAVGNHALDPNVSCDNASLRYACADPTEIAALATSLNESHDKWLMEITIFGAKLSAHDAVNPEPNLRVEANAPSVPRIYVGNSWNIPLVEGRDPVAADEIALHADLAKQLGVGVGDRVVLTATWTKGVGSRLDFTVTGLTVVPDTFPPFSLHSAHTYASVPLAIVAPAALPAIAGNHRLVGAAEVMWDGDSEVVRSAFPDAKVNDGLSIAFPHWFHAYWWLAVTVALATGSVARWAMFAGLRGPIAWRDGALLIPIPAATGIVAVTVAALAHAAWVRQIAPYTFLPKPLPLPMPWTITALAAGVAVAAAGAALREGRLERSRLQHHEVVDVDERVGEGLA